MAKRLVSYCPVFEGCVPERVHNQDCQFVVTYVSGCERVCVGRVSSVSALMRALRRRFASDSSLAYVCVYSPSRHLVASVGWHYRA